ncbi:MAG TPA: hypothetical protein VHR45_11135 [Thermoanaerobaculia bacterium]|nr:hypothetical protein [Thermoanaerobaculia bacterium]
MPRKPLHADDLPAETRKKFGLRKSRQQSFKREELRREAIAVLAQIRHLTTEQRRRVLQHALKVNEV